MRGRKSYWRGMAFFLLMLGVVLLWREGYLPGWVYEGPLRDQVVRRTGFDLADRASLDAPEIELREVEGVPGPVPAVVAEFENVGERQVAEYRAVAAFRSTWDDEGPRSAPTYVAGGDRPPLGPGERRRIRLESRVRYDPRTVTGGPAPIYADLYWGGSFNPDGTRRQPRRDAENEVEALARWHSAQPDVSDIVVRP